MLFFKMAVSVVCIICGFSTAVTVLVTLDKETPHKKREILYFLCGVILLIVGIVLLVYA